MDRENFIKSSAVNIDRQTTYAPLFRRKFQIDKPFESAVLSVCGLGIGYYYLNEKSVSEDLFTAPLSNYNKTVWYNEYDVTGLLVPGENIFAAILGNGWYNEVIPSAWEFHKADWRDTPKLLLQLVVDGEIVLTSDEQFRVTLDSPVIYNQLRCGEHFDARRYPDGWKRLDFCDDDWEYAIRDTTPPAGILRKCCCEPIREEREFPVQEIRQTGEQTYVFDIGQNISGYVRLTVCQNAGDVLTIRYGEMLHPDGSLNLNSMEVAFPESAFQTDVFVCSGKPVTWSPRFAYHGFRYIEITGITDINDISVGGVFVHQAVQKRTDFQCSNPFLNTLFHAGQMSCYSNMFYLLTDCPTREKLGWTNDAQASAEQMLTNFQIERLFEKWMVDIRDAMREDGCMPGIIPTAGWGYHWGNGPVSDGVLFELAYRVYLHTGRDGLLKENLPYFKRYLHYLSMQEGPDGRMDFGLHDWAAPGQDSKLPVCFINAVLKTEFLKITALSASLCGEDASSYTAARTALKHRIVDEYITAEGRCVFHEQTAVAMLIYYGLYETLEPLKMQLAALIEAADFHHNCGMVGLRRLYLALNRCGLQEYAYRIVTAKGYPSYAYWLDKGATTLWEMWEDEQSRNHHMYSDFMSWMIKTILGIYISEEKPGALEFLIAPSYLMDLQWAEGTYETANGVIAVAWRRENAEISLTIRLADGVNAIYNGVPLPAGEHTFVVKGGNDK